MMIACSVDGNWRCVSFHSCMYWICKRSRADKRPQVTELFTTLFGHSFYYTLSRSLYTHIPNRLPQFGLFLSLSSVVPEAKQLYKKADEVELSQHTPSFSRGLDPPPRKVSAPPDGCSVTESRVDRRVGGGGGGGSVSWRWS